MTTFQQDWRRFHGDAAPLSVALRATDKPWVRFHSLPASKRYAETAEEGALIIARANTIAAATLGNDETWLVQLGDLHLGWPVDALRPRSEFGLQFVGNYREDGLDWPAHAALTVFALGTFNSLITDIANERAFRTLWMSSLNGRIVAPYDGGIDVFVESDEAIANLKTRFHSWLPVAGDL